MRLLLFIYIGLPLFLGWIFCRLIIKKEPFAKVKDALYTGLFAFVFMGGVCWFLSK
jgi:hypothetical protein